MDSIFSFFFFFVSSLRGDLILLINVRKVFGEIRIVFSFYLVNRKDPFFNLFYVNFQIFLYYSLCRKLQRDIGQDKNVD